MAKKDEFPLGHLQFVLGFARHYFTHPTEDCGQWLCLGSSDTPYWATYLDCVELGYLLERDVPGIGRVYQITPKGLKVCEKIFPEERWHQWLTRSIKSWLWYKPRFYLRYGIWP